jgi:hypothetical protein
MANYKKQHILPKTYLKYFSKDYSGKGIITKDLTSQNDKIEIKNQGDKIFWKKNYYTDRRFEDKYIIEKSLSAARAARPSGSSREKTRARRSASCAAVLPHAAARPGTALSDT